MFPALYSVFNKNSSRAVSSDQTETAQKPKEATSSGDISINLLYQTCVRFTTYRNTHALCSFAQRFLEHIQPDLFDICAEHPLQHG